MPEKIKRIVRCLSWLLFIVSATGSTQAASPFIAGYDRFSDTQDLPLGKLLLSELSCTACHRATDPILEAKRGPALGGAGWRLDQQWMSAFLSAPQQVKPGTTMPDLLVGLDAESKQAAIDSLVAYMGSQLQLPEPLESTASRPIAVRFWEKGDAERGNDLYHKIGCVACHQPIEERQAGPISITPLEEELQEQGLIESTQPVGSIPLPDLKAKYSYRALTYFLIDPLAVRPAGRMPNLKLSPDEAADIAAYLLADPNHAFEPSTVDEDLVDQGRQWFRKLRCVHCHSTQDSFTPVSSTPLADLNWDRADNCLDQPSPGLPKFSIDADQRLAILQALEPAEQSAEVELRMLQLNCYACHERDSRGGVGIERRGYFETVAAVDLGDEGRLPPPLDGVGRKLTSNWLKRVFAGKGDIRPHMTIRMPIFGTATELLHAELPLADDTDPNNDPWQGVQPVADAGRQLLDLGCVQCHSIAGEQLPGVIGIDLAHIDQRINPRWFADFLLDPAALKQRTRMPAFFRGGRSSAPDVLAGDVDHQIASIWEYLGNVNKYPLPEKIEQGRVHDFELVPIDQPTLLRTFMREAGPHAIAVGFPEGVHLAFDAERVRIAQFWRGKFLDAHGTWFDRFAPPAVPLGQDVVNVTLARSADHPSHPEFDGYRLSAAGVPTFLYRIGDVEVQDTFRPTEQRGFHRELSFRVPERGEQKKTVAQVLVLSGSKITDDFTNDQGVRMHVMPASTDSNDTRIVNSADGRECYLEHSGSGTIKLRYRW